ncbi:tyrosine--tRNA ligase [Anaplasmataceae bacterium AB001_6]|nr:tyrosine--tRNA ligase [Anaplasmataceae bacterium AB001_6]
MKSLLLNHLNQRGFIYQCTNIEKLDTILSSRKIVSYVGFDCTARTLHIGSLIQIMLIRHLLKDGHKIIILLGGATTRIGDPSGKDKSRQYISIEEIEKNILGISQTLKKFFHEKSDNVIFLNNIEWFEDIKYLDMLRDIGKIFSINRMLEFESVKTRLSREQNLSFLEFNYMIMQAYDFLELNKRENCILQLGGSDQWGNIVNGVELCRKKENSEVFGLTTPLALTTDGKKMGKTANGAIWLDKDLLSPNDYWQYFRNIDDKDVAQFLKWFTDLEIGEINELCNLQSKEINKAKKILATQATQICHGEEIAKNVEDAMIKEFEMDISSALPIKEINAKTIRLLDLLISIDFASSNSEAKKKIRSGGVKINDQIVTDVNMQIDGKKKIAIGKKRIIIRMIT